MHSTWNRNHKSRKVFQITIWNTLISNHPHHCLSVMSLMTWRVRRRQTADWSVDSEAERTTTTCDCACLLSSHWAIDRRLAVGHMRIVLRASSSTPPPARPPPTVHWSSLSANQLPVWSSAARSAVATSHRRRLESLYRTHRRLPDAGHLSRIYVNTGADESYLCQSRAQPGRYGYRPKVVGRRWRNQRRRGLSQFLTTWSWRKWFRRRPEVPVRLRCTVVAPLSPTMCR